MSASDSQLQMLHKLTYGIQDVHIEKLKDAPQLTYKRIVEHVNVALVPQSSGRVIHTFIPYADMGIANVRMVGDNWSGASFLVGGQLFDRFHCARQGSQFSITDDGRCLPFVPYHDFTIAALKTGADDVRIEYDIVEVAADINEKLVTGRSIEFLYYSNQLTGIETVQAGVSKVRLHFNHPIKKIIVDVVSGHVDAMILTLQIGIHNDKVPLQKVNESQFILDMGKEGETINFSRVDQACLQVTAAEESVIDPRAISTHIIRMMSGMYGMSYTK